MAKAKAKEAVVVENDDYRHDWIEPLVSPIVAYPGTVSFPDHFTMGHFREWRKVNLRLQEIEAGEDFVFGLSGAYANGHIPPARFTQFDPRQWAHVLAVCDIALENLPADALTDESGESTPIEVLAWLIPVVMDGYLAEKLNLKNS